MLMSKIKVIKYKYGGQTLYSKCTRQRCPKVHFYAANSTEVIVIVEFFCNFHGKNLNLT